MVVSNHSTSSTAEYLVVGPRRSYFDAIETLQENLSTDYGALVGFRNVDVAIENGQSVDSTRSLYALT